MSDDAPSEGPRLLEWLKWFRQTDHTAVELARENVYTALLVDLVSFDASGIWPPIVAVESPSMEPHLFRGDLVFVAKERRRSPSFATGETSIVTAHDGKREEYRTFGGYGDVIVYLPNGVQTTPTIHRAEFWVNDSENWYDKANPEYVPGDSCEAIPNCPAPHAGFITKGDNNGTYDQTTELSRPVRPSWIRGIAEVKIPFLGHARLAFE